MTSAQFLLEWNVYDPDEAEEVTLRFATGSGFRTSPSETPAETSYYPRLKDVGLVETYLYGPARTTGFTGSSAGKIVLNNADGELNYLMEYGLDGRTVTIRKKQGSAYPTDFPIEFYGIVVDVQFSELTVELDIQNYSASITDKQYQSVLYAGTNDGATQYLEGTEDDLKDRNKPKVKGAVKNAPAVLVDRANEIYQLSSDEIYAIDNLYVGRAVITPGTQHTTLAALVAAATGATVTPGEYDYYLGDNGEAVGAQARGCYAAFGTTPEKQVTFDAQGGVANLALYSDDLSNAAWVKSMVTVSSDYAISPDGVTMADQITVASNLSSVGQTLSGLKADSTYTLTFMAKADASVGSHLAVYDEDNSAFIALDQDYEITDEWSQVTHTFDTPSGCNSVTIFPVHEPPAGFVALLWRVDLAKGSWTRPGTLTTSAAVLKDSAAQLTAEVLLEQGFSFALTSALVMDLENSARVEHYQGTNDARVDSVINAWMESAKGYWLNDSSGVFHLGVLSLPEASESVLTVHEQTLLGRPKIKYLRSADPDGGIPIYQASVNYARNYTEMGEADVYGSAELTDIPFVSLQYRTRTTVESASVRAKHLTSVKREVNTALVNEADAATRAALEMTLYGVYRPPIEIRLPVSIAGDLSLGSVFTLRDKLYRVIGIKRRFPNFGDTSETPAAMTLQGWGGVAV